MEEFKVGDKVLCIHGHSTSLKSGNIYTIKTINSFSAFCLEEVDHSCWGSFRFSKVVDNKNVTTKVSEHLTNNPCISAEVITTTKRKVIRNSSLKLGSTTIFSSIRDNGDGKINIGCSVYTVKQLKDFALQVLEIADVLDET